jgi:hypothetical protein
MGARPLPGRERKEFAMKNNQRIWLWLAAAVSFIVGLALVLNDNSGAGWFLIILGIINVGASTRAGQGLVASNPKLVRWGIVGFVALLILLLVIGAAVLTFT